MTRQNIALSRSASYTAYRGAGRFVCGLSSQLLHVAVYVAYDVVYVHWPMWYLWFIFVVKRFACGLCGQVLRVVYVAYVVFVCGL
jgi:hypothetical protein